MTSQHETDWLGIPDQAGMMAAALQFQLSQTQVMNAERLERIQFARLKTLVRHARESVPFYAGLGEIATLEDWRRLPLLSRRDIQGHYAEMKCSKNLTAIDKERGSLKTSGSTGVPVEIRSSQRSQLFWRAMTLRDHLWHGRDFSNNLGAIRYFPRGEHEFPGSQSDSWGASSATVFTTGSSAIINSSTPIELQYEWLLANRPQYLVTYPSLLVVLADLNLQRGRRLSFESISTIGEAVSEGVNELALKSFGVMPADIYSTQEVGYIALKCPTHDHYHVQSEMNFVELLNEQGDPCRPGELGRVVVTPLHNFVMPLIRYDLGDFAIPGTPGDCGINLPVVDKVVGRIRNLVTYPNGSRSWPPSIFRQLIDDLPESQFQLIQTSAGAMILKVASPVAFTEAQESQAVATLQEAFGYPFDIEIEKVDSIARSKGGKFEDFVSRL